MESRKPVVIGPPHVHLAAVGIVRSDELTEGTELTKAKRPRMDRAGEKELEIGVPVERIEPVPHEVGNVLDGEWKGFAASGALNLGCPRFGLSPPFRLLPLHKHSILGVSETLCPQPRISGANGRLCVHAQPDRGGHLVLTWLFNLDQAYLWASGGWPECDEFDEALRINIIPDNILIVLRNRPGYTPD